MHPKLQTYVCISLLTLGVMGHIWIGKKVRDRVKRALLVNN
jgi:hypothetical protein